jgi:hypothetical protein
VTASKDRGFKGRGRPSSFTPAEEAAIREWISEGKSYAEIGRVTGRSSQTIRGHFKGRNVSQDMLDRIHRAIGRIGTIESIPTLAAAVGIVESTAREGLYMLVDEGYATYEPVRNGKLIGVRDIRLTDKGREELPDVISHAQAGTGRSNALPGSRPADPTDFHNLPHMAPVVGKTERHFEQPTVVPAQPTPVEPQWPHLEALKERIAVATTLGRAALALPEDDPLRGDILARMESMEPTETEQEYLQYAAAHG